MNVVTETTTPGVELPSRQTSIMFGRDHVPKFAFVDLGGGIWLGATMVDAYLGGYRIGDRGLATPPSHNAHISLNPRAAGVLLIIVRILRVVRHLVRTS